MEEIFHGCLDHCSALTGMHATALVGHTICHLILQHGYLKLCRCALWSRTPGPYTDAFRLLGELGEMSCGGPRGHPSRVHRFLRDPPEGRCSVGHHTSVASPRRSVPTQSLRVSWHPGSIPPPASLSVVSVVNLESRSDSIRIHDCEIHTSC